MYGKRFLWGFTRFSIIEPIQWTRMTPQWLGECYLGPPSRGIVGSSWWRTMLFSEEINVWDFNLLIRKEFGNNTIQNCKRIILEQIYMTVFHYPHTVARPQLLTGCVHQWYHWEVLVHLGVGLQQEGDYGLPSVMGSLIELISFWIHSSDKTSDGSAQLYWRSPEAEEQ